jgi:hypothetical protein
MEISWSVIIISYLSDNCKIISIKFQTQATQTIHDKVISGLLKEVNFPNFPPYFGGLLGLIIEFYNAYLHVL